MADEFFSFDEALDELRLKEEELKRLVSEGEIRAFRKGDTMKLRKSDVESLRAELDTAAGGEVVDLGEMAAEELVFEDDTNMDDAGMATQEIADVDTLIEEDIEDVGEIDLEEAPVAVAASAVRRPRAASAAAAVEETESMGMRFFMIASAAVLFLSLPVAIAVSTGEADGLAKQIAGLFGNEFEQAPAAAPAPEE